MWGRGKEKETMGVCVCAGVCIHSCRGIWLLENVKSYFQATRVRRRGKKFSGKKEGKRR